MLVSIRAAMAVQSAMVLWGASSLARVPLTFEPGSRTAEFIAHSGGPNVILRPSEVEIGRGSMRLIGAQNNAPARPEDLLPSYSNYLTDPDPHKWRKHVPNYRRVRYRSVYRGIDVVYYGNPRLLEFDFVLSPRADPRRIQIELSDPNLQIGLPHIYQNGRAIEGRAVRRGNRVTFELAAYDRSRPLVIDPVLSYASVFGGGGADGGHAIAVDSAGSAYVVGSAYDGNFPVVNGASGQGGSFFAKINSAGDALVYSTYLSFPVAEGSGNVAVDSSGHVYFVGAFAPNAPGAPAVGPAPLGPCTAGLLYAAKLSSDGASLLYSGCIVGSIVEGPVVVTSDGNGNAYVGGTAQASDFLLVNPMPYTPPANPEAPRAFVLKLGPDGTLLYSSFVGGSNGDRISAIAADPTGNIYLAGYSNSADFPIKNAIQPRPPAAFPSFVAKIKADGSDYVYSTYFGGSNGDSVLAIAADTSGKAYLAGSTTSVDLPITGNALQSRFNGVFLFKTTDAANTWSRSDSGLSAPAAVVQLDPQQPSTVYAASAGGIFKSIDGGLTWHGTAATAVNSLWIDPVNSTLYIGTTHGDFVRSRDGGVTFTALANAPGGNLNQMAFDPIDGSVIYARWGGNGLTDGVYKSTDGGDTWKPTGLSGAMTGSGPLAIDPANPSTLYAEARSRGLVRSTDGGETWTVIGADVNQIVVDSKSTLYTVDTVSGSIIHVLPLSGVPVDKIAPGLVMAFLIDPTNSSTWYAATVAKNVAIYKSTDGGDTWQPTNAGLPDSLSSSAMSLALAPRTPQTLYLGSSPSSDGFFAQLSSDGTSLQYSTYLGGGSADASTAIAVDAAGNTYIAGTTDSIDFPLQGAFRQSGSGFAAKFDSTNKLVWSSLLGGAAPQGMALGPAGEVYLTGGASSADFPTASSIQCYMSSNFFYSADGGATWVASSPTPGAPSTGPFLTPTIAIDPKTTSRVYELTDNTSFGTPRLYVSNDRGQSWTPLGTPGPELVAEPFLELTLLLDPLTPTTMYSANICQPNSGGRICGVSKSTDGGMSWTVNAIRLPNNAFVPILGLAIDPKTPSNLYASTGFGIFKSTDGAATWNLMGSLRNAGAIAAVAVDPLNSAVVYASVGNSLSGGIYKSTDAGATFTAGSNGLPSGWFANSLVVDPSSPGRVYAIGSFPPTKNVYRTDDGGNNWMKIGSGLPDGPVSALAVDPGNSSVVYAALPTGGLYRSTDAGATFSLVPGLRIPIVSSVAIDPANSLQIYTGSQFNPSDAFVMKIAP